VSATESPDPACIETNGVLKFILYTNIKLKNMKKILLNIVLIALGTLASAQSPVAAEDSSIINRNDNFIITASLKNTIGNLYKNCSYTSYVPIWLGKFENGLARIESSTPRGREIIFINKNGDTVNPPIDDCLHIEDVWSDRSRSELKYGATDKNGKVVIPFQYELIYGFRDGITWARKNGTFCVINTQGNILFSGAQYEKISDFHEGVAWVKKNGRWGLINKNGKIVIPFSAKQYDDYGYYQNGVIWVMERKYGEVKYGVIDTKGNLIIPTMYDDFSYFEDNLAWAKKNGKWGIIDKNNKVVVPFQYNFDCDECENPAHEESEFDHNYLDDLYEFKFRENIAAVMKDDDKWVFVDRKGTIVSPFCYEEATRFEYGISRVVKDGEAGFIDAKGKYHTFSLNRKFGNVDGKFSIVGYSEGAFIVEYELERQGREYTIMGYMDEHENCTITDDLINNFIKR
jgi:hypothetical protein